SLPQDRGQFDVRRYQALQQRRERDPEVEPHTHGDRNRHSSGYKVTSATSFHIPSHSKTDVVVPVVGFVAVARRGPQIRCIVVPRPATQHTRHQTALPLRNANCPNICCRKRQVSPWLAWAIHERILCVTSSRSNSPAA